MIPSYLKIELLAKRPICGRWPCRVIKFKPKLNQYFLNLFEITGNNHPSYFSDRLIQEQKTLNYPFSTTTLFITQFISVGANVR